MYDFILRAIAITRKRRREKVFVFEAEPIALRTPIFALLKKKYKHPIERYIFQRAALYQTERPSILFLRDNETHAHYHL